MRIKSIYSKSRLILLIPVYKENSTISKIILKINSLKLILKFSFLKNDIKII